MDASMHFDEESSRRARAHEFFRGVLRHHRLPSLVLVASKILRMARDPNVKVRELCRLLSDDASLATRVLAVARSPHYAKRNVPRDLLTAVSALGLKTVRSIVLACATESLTVKGSRISEQLWAHSLAVGLGARILARRARLWVEEDAFLAGLLHDIGQMVFAYGDPDGYGRTADEACRTQEPLYYWEERLYGVDHALVGVTLLDTWHIEGEISTAVLHHHACRNLDAPAGLTTLVSLADFLSVKAGLGCVDALNQPPAGAFAPFDGEGEEPLAALTGELKEAFREEVALFRRGAY